VAAIFRAPLLILKGLAYMARLRLAKVPMLYDHMLIRAEGANRVEAAYVAEIDRDGKQISASEKRFEVDSICVGYGFIPNTDLTRLLRCVHKHDEDLGNLVAERGDDGATSRSGIFSVGDSGKLQGAQFALAQGTLAGFSVNLQQKRYPIGL
jgi:thioredoxin reductase